MATTTTRVTMEQALDQIEAIIDSTNVKAVLSMIGQICGEKASHIESNWQDVPLARQWMRTACKVDRLANALPSTPGIGYGS